MVTLDPYSSEFINQIKDPIKKEHAIKAAEEAKKGQAMIEQSKKDESSGKLAEFGRGVHDGAIATGKGFVKSFGHLADFVTSAGEWGIDGLTHIGADLTGIGEGTHLREGKQYVKEAVKAIDEAVDKYAPAYTSAAKDHNILKVNELVGELLAPIPGSSLIGKGLAKVYEGLKVPVKFLKETPLLTKIAEKYAKIGKPITQELLNAELRIAEKEAIKAGEKVTEEAGAKIAKEAAKEASKTAVKLTDSEKIAQLANKRLAAAQKAVQDALEKSGGKVTEETTAAGEALKEAEKAIEETAEKVTPEVSKTGIEIAEDSSKTLDDAEKAVGEVLPKGITEAEIAAEKATKESADLLAKSGEASKDVNKFAEFLKNNPKLTEVIAKVKNAGPKFIEEFVIKHPYYTGILKSPFWVIKNGVYVLSKKPVLKTGTIADSTLGKEFIGKVTEEVPKTEETKDTTGISIPDSTKTPSTQPETKTQDTSAKSTDPSLDEKVKLLGYDLKNNPDGTVSFISHAGGETKTFKSKDEAIKDIVQGNKDKFDPSTPENQKAIATYQELKAKFPNLNIKQSISDYMKARGFDNSLENRAKLAKKLGIEGYIGTAFQNVKLFALLKKMNDEEIAEGLSM